MTIGCFVLLGVLSLAAPPQEVEVAGGVSVPRGQDAQIYRSAFEPPFPFVTHTGTASQQITLDPAVRPGFWGSILWLPRPHVGFEVRGAFVRAPLRGTNGPFEISLSYESRQPPDNVLRTYELTQSTPWPATDGRIDELTFSGSLVGVLGDPRTLSLRLSGGVALTALGGEFEPLGFTTFQLGGHATVFSSQYALRMRIERTWVAGFEGGAEVGRGVGEHVTVTAGIRFRAGAEAEARLSVTEVSSDTAISDLAAEDAETALSAPPFRWRAPPVAFVAGVRIRL